ncbi:hypothetical protein [Phyllobacterium sp. YR531]|uniref:hypothetical protein n=1 Tax=Phyllobacterium sp. YR531 TaxID=1144343 RepID=UPI00026F8787|nr:hypothetical protein [Phyllobacterium sp. YR531]EJM99609.1 hypothetical protein PMI41_04069 [Phyllobacterium sp. YR531]
MATHKGRPLHNDPFKPVVAEHRSHAAAINEEGLPPLALVPPLKCVECDSMQLFLVQESEGLAPIHCPECGAFLCMWKDIVEKYALSEL